MQIRPAGPRDAATIAEIYVRSWRQSFAEIVPQAYLDSMDVRWAPCTRCPARGEREPAAG